MDNLRLNIKSCPKCSGGKLVEQPYGLKCAFCGYVEYRHLYSCRCPDCLQWWATMGTDENDTYGPFTEAEIKAYLALDKPTLSMVY